MPARPPRLVPAFPAAALALSLAAGPTQAQGLSELSPGTRVRVTSTSPELRRKVATVVAADSARLAVTYWSGTRRDTIALDSTSVSTLEVSRGRRRDVARGATMGLLGGIVSGVVMGALVDTCDANTFCFEPSMGEMVVGGAVVGLGVGSLVSLLAPRERWERWPRAPEGGVKPIIAPNPQGSGVRIGLHMAAPFLIR